MKDQTALKIYVPSVDAAELKAIAEREGRTLTGLLRMLIRDFLETREVP